MMKLEINSFYLMNVSIYQYYWYTAVVLFTAIGVFFSSWSKILISPYQLDV
jgi:hypothetical protein